MLMLMLVLSGLAYIRLAPSDPARWHVDPLAAGDPGATGVRVRRTIAEPPEQVLARFDVIARAEPRSRVLAGSVSEGMITYVVRSRLFGFPDYVTVRAIAAPPGTDLVILSRLRFGRSDSGVNRARSDRWLQRLQAVQD